MKTFLVVIFMMNGEPTMFVDGYQPREQPSMEVCENRAEFMADYLATVPGLPSVGKIVCGTEEEIRKAIAVLSDPIA